MDSAFYWASKIVWLVISPDMLLVLSIAAYWVLVWRGRKRLAARVLGLVSLVVMFLALFPVNEWVLYPLETRFPTNPALPGEIHGIIMLGGAGNQARSIQWGQPELNEAAERYFALISLAREFPDARVVIAGGSGSMVRQEFKETELAKAILVKRGIDLARVTFDHNSRNTYENALFTKELVNPQPSENWVLITSSWHMPRAMGVFCKVGWPVTPYPVDHYTNPGFLWRVDLDFAGHLNNLKYGMKEWVGLVAYYVTGKTSAVLPGPCPSGKAG